MKNTKRIIATVLTAVMMISMLPSSVFAAELDAYDVVEPAVEAVSVPAEEQEIESTVEDISVEDAEEVQGSSEEIETVDAADPEAADVIEDTEAPVVTEEKTTIEAEGKDYVVTVTYDASALLPDDVKVTAEEIKANAKKYDDYCDQALEAVQQENADVEELSYARLFDIKLVDAAGNVLEPASAVDVQIRLKDVESVEDGTQVVHFAGEEETPEVIEPTVDNDTVTFATDGFSIYAVVTSGENARLIVNFNKSATDTTTMYVKKKDIGNLNQVLYDPGVPVQENKKFLGWTDNASWANDSIDELKAEAMTIDDVREAVTTRLNGGVTDGNFVTYYAIMVNCFELYYQDEYNNTFKTENVLSTSNSGTTTVECPYTLTGGSATQNFIGWKVINTEEPVYKNGSTITISKNTTLVPAIGTGRWLWFDSNAGGAGVSEASYTAPQFVAAGDKPKVPNVPTRPGYTFDGWYDAAEGGNLFKFEDELPPYTPAEGASDEDSYVWAYAHWTPNPDASYKVIIWAQKVTDDKNAADEDKKYDYVATYEVENAVAGTVLDKTELAKSSDKYFEKDNAFFGADELKHGSTAFEYDRFEVVRGIGEGGNGVNPDDSTVVNVYYDRAMFTILFVGNGSTPHYYPVDEGENVYGLVDGEYVPLTSTESNKRIEWSRYKGSVELPTSITQVKYARSSGGAVSSDYATTNVSNLRYGGSTYANSTDLAKLPIGTNGTQAFVSGKSSTWYLYSTTSTNNTNSTFCQLKWTIKGDISYAYNGTPYTGQLYAKTTETGMAYTGLYGQTLEQNNYTWPTPNGSADAWDSLSWLEAFRGNLFGDDKLGLGTGTNKVGIPNTIIAKPASSETTSTIIFWFEDKDTPGQYNEVGRVRFYFDTDSRYNITERVLGAEFNGYQWTGSESMPSNWSFNVGSDGFTTDKRGTNTYMHIRYNRAAYSIRFMQGSNEIGTVNPVKYEESLKDYAARAAAAESLVQVGEDQFFDGWFEDPEGKKRVDWNERMPAGDKLIYAVVRNSQYHVFVDMDGGKLPSGQKNQFWENWGKTIDKTNFMRAEKTNDQGDSYTLVGYYLDEEMTRPWNFDIPLSQDYLWYEYHDTTDAEDPARRSEFFGEGNYDSNYPQCVGIFRLWAKWRDDSIVGGLHIRYTNPSDVGEGKEYTYEDEMHYEDMADVIAAQAPEERYWPDGKRFDGWQLTEGKVYQPGDMFIADNDYAVTADDNQRWITLTAVYVDKEERTPTHIYFYKNDGETTEPIKKYDNVDINKGYEVYAAPTRDGYRFLGWARDIETPVDDEGQPLKDPQTGELIVNTSSEKTVADFLEYKNGAYYLPGTETVVTKVAADEVLPYHGLYAVWEPASFTIVHSSDPENPVVITDHDFNDPFNMAAEVYTDYIYGGYKKDGVFCTDNGTAMKPVPGATYYLKEVSNKYLVPVVYAVWSKYTKRMQQFFILTDVDSKDYIKVGVDVSGNHDFGSADYGKNVYEQFTVTPKGQPEKQEKKTTQNIFGVGGYLGIADKSGYVKDDNRMNTSITLRAYYVTPDSVKVTGTVEKTINFNNLRYGNEQWNSSDGVQQIKVPNKTSDCSPYVVPENKDSLKVGLRSAHKYQIKVASEDAIIITKVDNGTKTTQSVKAGDNTGKITNIGKANYVFAGWYEDASYSKVADFANVSKDMTVYAKYVKASTVKLTFTKKSEKAGDVTLKATLKITDQPDIDDVAVDCGFNDTSCTVDFTGVKTANSGKTTVDTYSGTVKLSGLANNSAFTAVISYRTPDGTSVSLDAKSCKYSSGKVTVR